MYCMYVCMYVCMHVCTSMYIFTNSNWMNAIFFKFQKIQTKTTFLTSLTALTTSVHVEYICICQLSLNRTAPNAFDFSPRLTGKGTRLGPEWPHFNTNVLQVKFTFNFQATWILFRYSLGPLCIQIVLCWNSTPTSQWLILSNHCFLPSPNSLYSLSCELD